MTSMHEGRVKRLLRYIRWVIFFHQLVPEQGWRQAIRFTNDSLPLKDDPPREDN